MFEIGWTEILVIAIVALLVFPTKDLPKILRTTGQMVGKLRRMAGDFQTQFSAALREAEREADLLETKQQLEALKTINPVNDVRTILDPLRNMGDEIKHELESPKLEPMAAPLPLAETQAGEQGGPIKTAAPAEVGPPAAKIPAAASLAQKPDKTSAEKDSS